MNKPQTLSTRRVIDTWWPLAASWLFMAAEGPTICILMARLADPKINLAAFGGVVFPLALLIESPIIMLLSASTALCKDWASYIKIRRFMMNTSAALTLLHILVAFTPLYYLVVQKILGAPPEIVEPARIGLMVTTPWTWAIAYRRFNQGVLIRFGLSRTITVGTFIRLGTDIVILAIGYWLNTVPGVIVASTAIACGVISEAVYIGCQVRPVLKNQLQKAPPADQPINLRTFLHFYIPLAMTSLLVLLTPLVVSATLSRMPLNLDSLAVWPVLIGLTWMFRGLGLAYNEVVVALLDEPGSSRSLRRFAYLLSAATTGLVVLMAFTPLASIWFIKVAALNLPLARMALIGLWFTIPLPALSAWQSWYQGALMHSRRTRAITESVLIYLFVLVCFAFIGVFWSTWAGLYVGLMALLAGTGAQTVWLQLRSRQVRQKLYQRDQTVLIPHEPGQ